MDIKRAKQEIEHTIQAYLSKDEYGEYQIPAIRQRPVLLMGPPGIGKTQIMEQIAKDLQNRTGGLHHYSSYQTECGGTAVYQGENLRW